MTDKYLEAPKPTLGEAELRKYIDDRFGALDERLSDGDRRMQDIEDELAKNTKLTARVHDFLEGADAGLKVLGWLGSALKWLAPIATSIAGLWALFHGNADSHHPPPK